MVLRLSSPFLKKYKFIFIDTVLLFFLTTRAILNYAKRTSFRFDENKKRRNIMKKAIPAILIALFIAACCIFISCNGDQGFINPDNKEPETDNTNYTEIINDLKDQIIELKQNQYISDVERNSEIARLEALIKSLTEESEKQTETSKESDTSDKQEDTSKDTSTSTEESMSETESDTAADTTVTEDIFTYILVDGGVSITGYTGSSDILTIPSSIDGKDVVSIADSAFESSDIKSVIIPDSVTKIGWFSFKGCKNLRTVTIPQSVTSIGYSAFGQSSSELLFLCSSESFAAKYAESYGIRYTPV